MKVEMEIDDDWLSEQICKDLRWHYENMRPDANDEKYQKKLLKAIKKVHNFYAKPSEWIE